MSLLLLFRQLIMYYMRLVNLVTKKYYPELYDMSDRNYNNKKKANWWEQISQTLNVVSLFLAVYSTLC